MALSIHIDRSNPLPLYVQLKNALQREIRSGQLAYGDKLPSEPELHQQLGLSRMTIRNALSELVSENYIQKMPGKGSFVCYNAAESSAGKIDVLLDVTYSYFSSLYIKSISESMMQHNYQFVIYDTQDKTERICDTLERILQNGSAGILLQPSHLVEAPSQRLKDLLISIANRGIPLVTIDRTINDIACVNVRFDDFAGAQAAAEYLISLGHKKFAMVCRSIFTESAPRYNGFDSVLLKNNLEPLIVVDYDDDYAKKLVSLVRNENVTAIFNYSDAIALKTMRYLNEANIRIPEDVSVVGFDDTVFANATNPSLTSVIHPKEMLGHIAAEMLISIVEQYPYTIPEDLLTPKISIKDSCAAPSKESEEIK